MSTDALARVLGPEGAGNKVAVGFRQIWQIFGGRNWSRLTRADMFPWGAVLIGVGIWLWFQLPNEPTVVDYSIASGLFLAGVVLRLWGPERLQLPFSALLCLLAGFLACGLRVWVVDAPIIDFRYYGAVTGRVVELDRSQTDALRVTLDQVKLDRVPPSQTPKRVRVSLRSNIAGHSPAAGEVVMMTAHLSAPQGPTEPGGFDFRRMAYFDQLGALGYTTMPVVLWQDPQGYQRLIDRLRSYLSKSMMAAMNSQAGAFAAGAMTGDRSGITQSTVADLRDSSLAHLLAISGMNLAFLISFVFALFRNGLALIPWIALRVNTKKVAAVASFGVAAFYLALSGSNVATERAFLMVSVFLGAILLDRRAISIRSLALSGALLLLLLPESLLEPGFQMSFAATAALVAGFRGMEKLAFRRRLPKWGVAGVTLVASSLIGGLATAPYAAATFNRFAEYGLVANLLTVPVMGAVVMPAGAIAALLAPLGLQALPLWAMEQGAAWILFVAHWVSGWSGAVLAIPSPGPFALQAITFGGIWLILIPGPLRKLALPMIAMGAILWVNAPRPDVLIASNGGLVGVLSDGSRSLSAPKGNGFEARSWLENDGDLASQIDAASRDGFADAKGGRQFTLGTISGVALKGKGALDQLASACQHFDLVVIAAPVPDPPTGCTVFDEQRLGASGGVAIYALGPENEFQIVPNAPAGRAWSSNVKATDQLGGILRAKTQVKIAGRSLPRQ